jgi:hypothetical protein
MNPGMPIQGTQGTDPQVESACTRLCIAFANHIDARRYGEWLDLFIDEAVLDRLGTRLVGRAALQAFVQGRSTTVETRHLCSNIQIRHDGGDEASGFSLALFYQGVVVTPGQPPQISAAPSVVENHDVYRRTAQGWRIQERRIRMALQG